jgi:hypothetical protein
MWYNEPAGAKGARVRRADRRNEGSQGGGRADRGRQRMRGLRAPHFWLPSPLRERRGEGLGVRGLSAPSRAGAFPRDTGRLAPCRYEDRDGWRRGDSQRGARAWCGRDARAPRCARCGGNACGPGYHRIQAAGRKASGTTLISQNQLPRSIAIP